MTPHEEAFHKAHPWLSAFQAGFGRTPSDATLAEARRDFLHIFFNGGLRQVEAFLSWLKPHRMSLAAFDCLLDAAEIAGVRLPGWWRNREKAEEILSARSQPAYDGTKRRHHG